MRKLPVILAVAAALGGTPARAVEAPYEQGLLRLAEILGSLHFLRQLCGETGEPWRAEMEALLESENPEPALRARFVASFNRGYRTFEATYTSCTPSAARAITLYMREGETLSRDIATRYGN